MDGVNPLPSDESLGYCRAPLRGRNAERGDKGSNALTKGFQVTVYLIPAVSHPLFNSAKSSASENPLGSFLACSISSSVNSALAQA